MRPRFPTGTGLDTRTVTFQFSCRDTDWFKQAIVGALVQLASPFVWFQDGDITPAQAAEAGAEMMISLRLSDMIGTIVPYVGDGLIPAGLLICDGATYNQADYPALIDRLPAYLRNDVAGTFRTPDLRGRTVVGSGEGVGLTNRSPGQSFGGETHTLTEAEMPAHSHSYTPPTINIDVESPGVPDPQAAGIGFPAQTGSAGGGQAHNNMQPSFVLVYVLIAR